MKLSLREMVMTGGAALAVACQGAPSAPESPTWTEDTYPVFQANCAGCHGPGGSQNRYDFAYDADNQDCSDLVTAYNARYGASEAHLKLGSPSPTAFKGYVEHEDEASRMPPPPADRLPSWQIEVLTKWKGRDLRDNNTDPEARSLALPKSAIEGSTATKFFVDVSDPDGDQVIGQVKISTLDPINVQGVGRTTVDLSDADVGKIPAGKHDVNVDLCDGQTKVTIKVGTITKK